MGIAEIFSGAILVLKTADEIGQLIAKLQDHQRTLDQAEADRRTASARLDAPLQ